LSASIKKYLDNTKGKCVSGIKKYLETALNVDEKPAVETIFLECVWFYKRQTSY